MAESYVRKPAWLKVQLESSNAFREVRKTLTDGKLHTVCEEARCPNRQECWGVHKTATFMILGDTCTRRCRFCAVKTGLPGAVDASEPLRVAESCASMGLSHVVLTMVTRDDLSDGGAKVLADTVRAIRRLLPEASIEVLSSDLMGKRDSIAILADSRPDILSHNLETVRRLTSQVRSRSDYDRSLAFLKTCAGLKTGAAIKSSLMLGLGEVEAEIEQAMDDLLEAGVNMMNLGQYLQPSIHHLPVQKYWTPEEFASLKRTAQKKGLRFVEAGPLVRSSYHAGSQYKEFQAPFAEGSL